MNCQRRLRRSRGVVAIVVSFGIAVTAGGGDDEPDASAQPVPTAAPAEATVAPPAEPSDVPATATATTAPSAPDASGATTAPAQTPTTTLPPVEAPEALRFTAPLVGGGTIDAASLAGTPVLFWFWAPY